MHRLTSIANLLSLDAVAVGVVWMAVFSIQFTRQWPSAYEFAIIGGAIWITYTIDRILDGFAVTDNTSATDRHRFHQRHRGTLTLAWCVAVMAVAWTAANVATERQLRGGLVMVALAICYVISAQWLNRVHTLVPKELRAGTLFAMGVSLTSWTSNAAIDVLSLGSCTALTAGLFTINCIFVSSMEIEIDGGQGNDSIARRFPHHRPLQTRLPLYHAAAATATCAIGLAPPAIALLIVASDACLVAYGIKFLQPDRPRSAAALRASLADATLVIAPLIWITMS